MRIVNAEIVYRAGMKTDAARAMQQLGFHILDVGDTISVRAPPELWTSTFAVRFEQRTKQVTEGVSDTYLTPLTDQMRTPNNLDELIADVLFVEPPEYFGS